MNITQSQTYNGWANYETWNVALWIQNDESMYHMARQCDSYTQWLRNICEDKTPDGVNYFSSAINVAELDQLILEL